MALPVNVEVLQNKRKIESNRIEFKKGWNLEGRFTGIPPIQDELVKSGLPRAIIEPRRNVVT